MDDSENCAQQTEQRRNHSYVGKVNDPIVQTGRHACSFRLGDFADMLEICVGIFSREIQHLLHDAGDRFPVPVGNREQPEIIAFTQERIRRCHVPARDHGPAPDRQEVNDHKGDEKDRQ